MDRYITVGVENPRYFVREELPEIIERIESENPDHEFVQLVPATMSREAYVILRRVHRIEITDSAREAAGIISEELSLRRECILVADNTPGSRKSYAERYMLFHDRQKAIDKFLEIGGVIGFGPSFEPGTANVTTSDVDVMMLTITPTT